MAWRVRLERAALRDLDKLDRQASRRILVFAHGPGPTLDGPRSVGEALKGSVLGELGNTG